MSIPGNSQFCCAYYNRAMDKSQARRRQIKAQQIICFKKIDGYYPRNATDASSQP